MMEDKSMFELCNELNHIMVEINTLEIRYNQIIAEMHRRNEKLKEDVNLQPKVLTKRRNYEEDKTRKRG